MSTADLASAGSLESLVKQTEAEIAPVFSRMDSIAFQNTERVADAFAKHRVSEAHFMATTGYGYDDNGRITLDAVFADALCAPAALVRPHFMNGTHAIACALYGALRAGDTLLCATGLPYDTLRPVIFGEGCGSLKDYGVQTEVADFLEPDESFDPAAHAERLRLACRSIRPKAALLQRSRGYSLRPALSVEALDALAALIKAESPETIVIVDNCYGEFTESREPDTRGPVDLICGSLIKNPGGGLAPTGGYVAGKAEWVEQAACRLGVPGIGSETGSNPDGYRLYYQGLFLAPHTVAQALKTAVFAASIFSHLGFETSPAFDVPRYDIIQSITFGQPEPMLRMMRGIQAGAPVDSYVTPEPWAMPGYADQVVMAAGAFIQGASIELSADGPFKAPYTAFLQGALTYESGKLGIVRALKEILQIQ